MAFEPDGKKTEEDIKQDIEEGLKDEEVYTEEGREMLVEDGEISPAEEAFMEGAEGRGQDASCTHCGKLIGENHEGVVEKEIDGKRCLFCCDECAEKGKR